MVVGLGVPDIAPGADDLGAFKQTITLKPAGRVTESSCHADSRIEVVSAFAVIGVESVAVD
jgi:hypothetical protein